MTITENKTDEMINSSRRNFEAHVYKNTPLFDKEWDYAVIVEIEDNEKKARVDYVNSKGEEIASLVSIITDSNSLVQRAHINGELSLDKLREYLPDKFKGERILLDF